MAWTRNKSGYGRAVTDSNTAKNTRKPSGKPFSKGDPRINRKGRPKSFDALRELAQQIAHQQAIDIKTGEPSISNGHIVTIAEAIMRQWAFSKNPQLQKAFIEVAFGKVPDAIQHSGEIAAVQMTLSEWRKAQEERRSQVDDIVQIDDE